MLLNRWDLIRTEQTFAKFQLGAGFYQVACVIIQRSSLGLTKMTGFWLVQLFQFSPIREKLPTTIQQDCQMLDIEKLTYQIK